MSSLRRIKSSRANGSQSQGPVSAQGKSRASLNALRHGLMAKCVVLQAESPQGFQETLDEYLLHFQPTDAVELGLVEEMVSAWWRLRRTWAIETRLLDTVDTPDNLGPDQGLPRISAAFQALSESATLPLLHRYFGAWQE